MAVGLTVRFQRSVKVRMSGQNEIDYSSLKVQFKTVYTTELQLNGVLWQRFALRVLIVSFCFHFFIIVVVAVVNFCTHLLRRNVLIMYLYASFFALY